MFGLPRDIVSVFSVLISLFVSIGELARNKAIVPFCLTNKLIMSSTFLNFTIIKDINNDLLVLGTVKNAVYQ